MLGGSLEASLDPAAHVSVSASHVWVRRAPFGAEVKHAAHVSVPASHELPGRGAPHPVPA
jgi:hypothetical protein